MSRPVNLSLDDKTVTIFRKEANQQGLSLSAYFRALARIMSMEITWSTPLGEIRNRFHELLKEEKDATMRDFLK